MLFLLFLREPIEDLRETCELLLCRIADRLRIVQPDHRTFGKLREEILVARVVIAMQIGYDNSFRQTFHTELILWIETAYAFHRITEKFDPERLIAAVAEYIDDAATDAELPGFVNEFHARELH